MDINLNALAEQNLKEDRYTETARLLTGDSHACPQDGIQWVKTLVATLKIPGLSCYGISKGDFPDIIEKARTASSMKANPVSLDDAQLTCILQAAL